MTNKPSEAHNAALLPILRLITEHGATEPAQWVIMESLCLGIGKLHGRSIKEISLFVETMAERFADGSRS